ncbi:hypothetical protein BKH44_05600 [Helicobacter sp. 13S00477-4]|nr:hypothetical protein BKH44_05600 [Helicobacter sp. 13S00477-4]
MDSNDFDKAIKTIIKIDNNNTLFENILKEPAFSPTDYPDKQYKALMNFFDNIFSQDFSKANRRKNEHWFKNHDFAYKQMTSMLCIRQKISQSKISQILKKTGIIKILKSPFS